MKLREWVFSADDFRVFNEAGWLVKLSSITDVGELQRLLAREIQSSLHLADKLADITMAHLGPSAFDVEVDAKGDPA